MVRSTPKRMCHRGFGWGRWGRRNYRREWPPQSSPLRGPTPDECRSLCTGKQRGPGRISVTGSQYTLRGAGGSQPRSLVPVYDTGVNGSGKQPVVSSTPRYGSSPGRRVTSPGPLGVGRDTSEGRERSGPSSAWTLSPASSLVVILVPVLATGGGSPCHYQVCTGL